MCVHSEFSVPCVCCFICNWIFVFLSLVMTGTLREIFVIVDFAKLCCILLMNFLEGVVVFCFGCGIDRHVCFTEGSQKSCTVHCKKKFSGDWCCLPATSCSNAVISTELFYSVQFAVLTIETIAYCAVPKLDKNVHCILCGLLLMHIFI